MKRTPVDSSLVRSVGYDAQNEILEIEFQSGGVYQYFDVPALVHEELMNAGSKGHYFLDEIRDLYGYQRVR